MIRLIDNTLTSLDHNLPDKEELHSFCELLFAIGVDAIELSIPVYQQMGYLPEGQKYILNINFPEEKEKNPGFYRYVSRYEDSSDKFIYEIQMNDTREIVRLRTHQNCKEIRIVGLDDLICYDSYERILREMIHAMPNGSIILCPENTYYCASALAIQWASDFGGDITTSFAACKNNAATEEVIMALRLAIRHKPNRNLAVLPQLVRLYEKFTNKPIGNKKPIVGKHIFKVEAGIHVDGIKKNPATYEAYAPSIVGGTMEVVIGKHSGSKAVKLKLEELGYPIPSDQIIDKILKKVKSFCTEHGRSLYVQELAVMIKEVADYEADEVYR
ncbi:MAG: hypothetical protein K0S76_508 [Herbinix sp.]|jgi:homocitrate synthase NifV|nr:hypothetical protein [Herbinix sp.]